MQELGVRSQVRRWLVVTGGTGAVALLATGCCGGGIGKLGGEAKAAVVTITPANGAGQVKPDAPIDVKVAGGTLQDVTVRGSGVQVTGRLLAGGKQWVSGRTLTPGASYTVTARAKNSGGKVVTATSAFTTLKPARPFGIADVTPSLPGEKVGVGIPIIVTFTGPVTEKAAVERVLKVTAEKPVEGAWRWYGPNQVIYRTKDYWPAHQKVRFTAQLAGVRAAKDSYGMKDAAQTFQIGAAQITTGDIGEHRMTVTRDGKKLRTIPFSAGNGTTREYTTTSGVHLLMEKDNPVTMVSPGRKPGDPGYYKTVVNYAVRFSNSGEYVHSAPWSVGSQGSANVSHGCLNVSPSNAQWFYEIAQRGDVLKLTGSSRDAEYDNGWSWWQMPFDEWKQGSALD